MHRRNLTLSALLFALALTIASGFTIEGTWELQSTTGIDVSTSPVTLNISDVIFRNQSILQKLSFEGCQEMLLQAQMVENQIFINFNSYLTQPIKGKTCLAIQNNTLTTIYSRLNKVFYFQINIDTLLFNDPYGVTVLRFKRLVPKRNVDISGIWSMNQFGNTRTALSVQISPSQITLCQGSAVYNYSFPTNSKNGITLKAVTNTCPSQDLIKAVESVKYYRLNNGILDLYDSKIQIAVEMIYSQAFDPSKPIFGGSPPQANSNTRTPPAAINSPSSGSSTSQISTSNLAGRWSIDSLFGIPFPTTPYSLTFTANQITLNGGCNTFNYPYTIDSVTQLITVGNGTSTLKACAQSDDQLYVSGIQKMYKYLLSSNSTVHALVFYDRNGSAGYRLSMRRTAGVSGQSPPTTTPAQPDPLGSGTFLLLLLKRRDLPRAIVNLTGTTLTYSQCNTMTHKLTISNPKASSGPISIALQTQTEKACSRDNDKLYIDTLDSATSFRYDQATNTVFLSDKSGV